MAIQPAPVFFDTNVLLYGSSGDLRREVAVASLLERRGYISVQVLNEMVSVARRKLSKSWDEVEALIDPLRNVLTIVPVTERVHDIGRAAARRYNLAVYDAMIVAAALEANCSTLYSEDMQNGLVVEGRLTIVNPFSA